MRIAIISDIHGNLEALKSTLKDIEKRNVNKIICLGDVIAKGTHPKECLDLVREKCETFVIGNCDLFFAKDHKIVPNAEDVGRLKWNQSLITKEDRTYILNLPYSVEFYMSGSLVRLYHATPQAIYNAVTNLDTIETKYKMFLPSCYTESQEVADVIIYGHIHHPYMDKLYNKTLINVGSVGNAFDVIRNEEKDSNVLETTNANYLIIEGEYGSLEHNSEISFQFIKVPYDIEKELEDKDKNIEKDIYDFELRTGMYRNMKKIYDNFIELGIDIDKI